MCKGLALSWSKITSRCRTSMQAQNTFNFSTACHVKMTFNRSSLSPSRGFKRCNDFLWREVHRSPILGAQFNIGLNGLGVVYVLLSPKRAHVLHRFATGFGGIMAGSSMQVRHLPPMIKRAGMMMHQLYERLSDAVSWPRFPSRISLFP